MLLKNKLRLIAWIFFFHFVLYSVSILFVGKKNIIMILSSSIIESEVKIQSLLDNNCNPNLINISQSCIESMKSVDRH